MAVVSSLVCVSKVGRVDIVKSDASKWNSAEEV